MERKPIIKWSFIAFGIIILMLSLVVHFTSVSITPPMIAIPLFVTRNGQELPPDQIKSVQYKVSEDPAKFPREHGASRLQEARYDQSGYYRLGASFSIYRYNGVFPHTEVKPNFRSIFLRITFVDGKTLSINFPIISDTRENLPMYVDLADPQR